MALKNMTAMSRIIRLQLMTGMIGGVLLLLLGHSGFAIAFAYGVLLMSINAWWLARRLESTSDMNAEAGQRSIFAGAVLRFVALIAGLLLGQLMGLHLMLVAAGIFVAQVLVYMFALFELKKEQF
ncbi:MAG: ATP synthase subunit I [Mariprofundus sp.]|nr:ATP synthase subunit I [Mariprofundus sp.]